MFADALKLPPFSSIEERSVDRWPINPRQVMIDNRDYSAPFQFTVNFDDMNGRYTDVVAAELKAISFPKILSEAYVVMKIDEISGNLDSKNTFTDQAFAVVFFDSEDMVAGETKAYKGADFYSKKNILSPVKNIDKLHVTFFKPDGSVVTDGDTAGRTNVSFIIELSCR